MFRPPPDDTDCHIRTLKLTLNQGSENTKDEMHTAGKMKIVKNETVCGSRQGTNFDWCVIDANEAPLTVTDMNKEDPLMRDHNLYDLRPLEENTVIAGG